MAKPNYTEDDVVRPWRENICHFTRTRVAGVCSVTASRQIIPGFSKAGIHIFNNHKQTCTSSHFSNLTIIFLETGQMKNYVLLMFVKMYPCF